MKANNYHETVLAREVVEALHIEKSRKYIDATAGNGGHMAEIIEKGGEVLGIDLDPANIEIIKERLQGKSFKIIHGNFIDIDKIANDQNWSPVSGILFDLGVTNIHLKDLERGFSFENPQAPLDMRIDPTTQGVKAADLMNVLRPDQLEELFATIIEPGAARWLVKRVVYARNERPISTIGDMLEIIHGLKVGKQGLHEATLPFLALRIAVNSELDNLKAALPKAFEMLEEGGRLAVISFHSKEDEIVKEFMRSKVATGAKEITFKPVMAGVEEMNVNRRARSAKMRVIEK